MNAFTHTIPVGGGEPIHFTTQGCWCHPMPDPGSDGQIIVHNAKDIRERFECHGITDPDKKWVLVGGVTP
jgi:hypothetical protein